MYAMVLNKVGSPLQWPIQMCRCWTKYELDLSPTLG